MSCLMVGCKKKRITQLAAYYSLSGDKWLVGKFPDHKSQTQQAAVWLTYRIDNLKS